MSIDTRTEVVTCSLDVITAVSVADYIEHICAFEWLLYQPSAAKQPGFRRHNSPWSHMLQHTKSHMLLQEPSRAIVVVGVVLAILH